MENPKFSAIIDQWEVQYGRFCNYGTTKFSSTHLSLIPASHRKRLRGTWISTDAANLELQYQLSPTGSDDAVLVISVTSRVIEEHFISKMHFSWPQVSCVAGFPARGSKAVFVNYKDRAGQIQKFAMWFSTAIETEKFMNILKEILGNGRVKSQQCSEFTSELSSQDEVVPIEVVPLEMVPFDELCYRPCEEYLQLAISANNGNQDLISQERVQNPEASMTMSAFPPSFSELVKNCHLTVDEAAKPIDSGDSLKSQFMQYLEGCSLKELMATIEGYFGDDIMF